MKDMYLPPEFQPRKRNVLFRDDYENSPGHVELTERLCKSLYYGRNPSTERPSLPVTEMCVEFFQEASPRGLGRVEPFYASSVGRRACISPCSMMLGMIYIDRLKKRNSEYLKKISSSDLFLISMMVASKYLYDEGVDEEVFNDEWADSAKMDTEEVNQIEMNFLSAIDWSLFVQPCEFQEMLNRVEKRIAMHQGIDRGWFSYMDLQVLTEDGQAAQVLLSLVQQVSKVMMVCSIAYVAGLITLVMAPMSLTMIRSPLLSVHHPTMTPLSVEPAPEKNPVVVTVPKSADQDPLLLPLGSGSLVESQENKSEIRYPGPIKQDLGQLPQNSMTLEKDGHLGRFSLPHFMTLAFIGETVNTVFGRMFDKCKNDHKKMDASEKKQDHNDYENKPVCSPGHCGGESTLNCRNFSNVEEYEDWCLSCFNWLSADSRDSPAVHGYNRQRFVGGFGCSAPPLVNVFPSCCCRKSFASCELSSRLNQPYLDIALGFGTTVLPV